MKATENHPLTISDGSDWHFVNGRYRDGENHFMEVSEETCRGRGESHFHPRPLTNTG
ncbi:MAG: hypothetical protein HY318_07225 [Armatimonadetes bacterium]|nr:hypothetical protein [Armatimonadota bacterium]